MNTQPKNNDFETTFLDFLEIVEMTRKRMLETIIHSPIRNTEQPSSSLTYTPPRRHTISVTEARNRSQKRQASPLSTPPPPRKFRKIAAEPMDDIGQFCLSLDAQIKSCNLSTGNKARLFELLQKCLSDFIVSISNEED